MNTTSIDSSSEGITTSEYAKKAIGCTVEGGLISGKGNSILAPHGNATRTEIATILTRFDELFTK